jgi:hypothetical protein
LVLASIAYFFLRHPTEVTKSLESPTDYYNTSCNKIRSAGQLELTIEILTTQEINSFVFTETNTQTFRVSSLGSNNMKSQRFQTIVSGQHKTELTETYLNGNVYVMLSGNHFYGPCTVQDFLQQSPPPILLDSSKYTHIEGTIRGSNAVISFSGATQIEDWCAFEGAELVSAHGSAHTVNDQLQKSNYSVTYRIDNVLITKQYTVKITETAVSIPTKVDTNNYTELSSPYAPLALEIAAGYLSQAPSVSAEYNEYIHCEAFGDTREKNVNIFMHQQDQWCTKLETAVTLFNTSQTDKPIVMRQTETYINGQHLVSQNGCEPKEDATTTESSLRGYCNELLLGTIILPQHITGVDITQTPSAYRIEYNVNDDFVRSVSHYSCNTLYNDPSVMERMADSEDSAEVSCYLELSKSTLLPIASGVQYSNTYIINDLGYQLVYNAHQQYILPDINAQKQILTP